MYKVIKYFTDLKDGRYAYHVGDTFPREGVTASEDRLKELSTDANRQHTPLIEWVEETVEEAVVEDTTEEAPEEPKEEPQEAEPAKSPSKPAKAKKSAKKA